MKKLRYLLLASVTLLISGCKVAMLDPKGVIAASEKSLLIDSTLLMLIVVIPVVLMSLYFAWRFRESNRKAKYSPGWTHSNTLELICWAVPGVIIVILAIITWVSSHTLDPYRPLDVKGKPLVIQAIALDWKWLFIYPEQQIAAVNFVQIPVNQPVRFEITADAPMNSLEIPQLAGQIYAMAGMRTKLNLMATEDGLYDGMSANFSGDGFSNMRFKVKVTSKKAFQVWVKTMQHSPNQLSIDAYKQLAKPSLAEPVNDIPVAYYSSVAKDLFTKVILMYKKPGMTNLRETLAKSANGKTKPLRELVMGDATRKAQLAHKAQKTKAANHTSA